MPQSLRKDMKGHISDCLFYWQYIGIDTCFSAFFSLSISVWRIFLLYSFVRMMMFTDKVQCDLFMAFTAVYLEDTDRIGYMRRFFTRKGHSKRLEGNH